MELIKIVYQDDDEYAEDGDRQTHYGICAKGCSHEVGTDIRDELVQLSETDLGFLEITESAWQKIMPHHEEDEFELSEIIARLLDRMDYDFVRLFRYIIYRSWPQVKRGMIAQIEVLKDCIDDVRKEQEEWSDNDNDEWIELYTNQIESFKWLSNADDAMIIGFMKDSLSHVAKMMESDMIDDTGHSIN